MLQNRILPTFQRSYQTFLCSGEHFKSSFWNPVRAHPVHIIEVMPTPDEAQMGRG
jgi:hypothetical protein